MIYVDSHIHLAEIALPLHLDNRFLCAVTHSVNDFLLLEQIALNNREKNSVIIRSFGIHPQNPDSNHIPFLTELLEQNRISAIGEAGFDFFTKEFAKQAAVQEQVWHIQTDLAVQYQKPIIVHCRHALDRIFADYRMLKKIPAVIFHSWAGSPQEADSLLQRGVNAYFSLGKPLLNGNKRALLCASQIAAERLLPETDAPYQTLKGETVTKQDDIIRVYQQFAQSAQIPVNQLALQFADTFKKIFTLSVD